MKTREKSYFRGDVRNCLCLGCVGKQFLQGVHGLVYFPRFNPSHWDGNAMIIELGL